MPTIYVINTSPYGNIIYDTTIERLTELMEFGPSGLNGIILIVLITETVCRTGNGVWNSMIWISSYETSGRQKFYEN